MKNYYKKLQSAGYEIIGISTDSASSHQKFIEKHTLPFQLITDQNHIIAQKYGTWIQLFMQYAYTSRKTFIVDEKGNIKHIIHKVKTSDHAAQILKTISP